MQSRRSSATRELLSLYSCASRGEHNLGAFLRERPDLAARLEIVELDYDDSELALQLAPRVGRYKRRLARERADERAARSVRGARALAIAARPRQGRVELDASLLFGDLLADASHRYIAFELAGTRVAVHHETVLRARAALRRFELVFVWVDELGLHFGWRGGRGGLNLRPQPEIRGTTAAMVDLRTPTRASRPIPLSEVLADLGLI